MRGAAPASVTLVPVGRSEFGRVGHIAAAPEQQPFCGTVRGHFDADEAGCDFHAVLCEDRAVGFFKIDRNYAARFDFATPRDIGLRGMMIDHGDQGRGIGTAAMGAMRAYLRLQYPGAAACVLTVNTVNPGARTIYLSGGFVDTGHLYHGGRIGSQHIMRMALQTV